MGIEIDYQLKGYLDVADRRKFPAVFIRIAAG
jgi:hypothetical protein